MTTSTTLSDVPNVSTAQFFSGSGTRSITFCPTATTGELDPLIIPTSSSATASPAAGRHDAEHHSSESA